MAYTTIDDSEAYFQAKIYTGNGSTQSLTFDGDTDMSPDLVWIKSRSRTDKHTAWDSVRTAGNCLFPSENNADESQGTGVTAFGSDGFSLGAMNDVNYSSATFAAWCWKETADAGFDIVSYTGNGSARTISHSLSAVPNFMMVKNVGASSDWRVYTETGGNGKWMQLNDNSALQTASTIWNDTSPTSSVFSVGTSAGVNTDGVTYIAYLFANKQGFSKFGIYTGNAANDGPFVFTGFRPAWIMTKITGGSDNWQICDNKRDPGNAVFSQLNADNTDAQNDGDAKVDFLSNGFKVRKSGGSWNGSGSTFFYAAFAEAPVVNSNGVPGTAR